MQLIRGEVLRLDEDERLNASFIQDTESVKDRINSFPLKNLNKRLTSNMKI